MDSSSSPASLPVPSSRSLTATVPGASALLTLAGLTLLLTTEAFVVEGYSHVSGNRTLIRDFEDVRPTHHQHQHHQHNYSSHHHHHHHDAKLLGFNKTSVRCRQGSAVGSRCLCFPCWGGRRCEAYEDEFAPRFLVHKATAVVPANVTGSVYRAWASDEDLGLTCPLGPGEATRCPCAAFTYQLFSPAGDHRFVLHPSTGLLMKRTERDDLVPGQTYSYKLMVQSVVMPGYSKERLYDILDLDIFVGPNTLQTSPWI